MNGVIKFDMIKILIMGLPGAGKTTLASVLKNFLESNNKTVTHLNADEVRKIHNDWDFTESGRIRQSIRMFHLAKVETSDFVIADFVAPLPEMRSNFSPDWIIWVDTITEGRFIDTNNVFVPPRFYDFKVTKQDAETFSKIIGNQIINSQ
jgi:adenylylsulfate kinase